MMSSAAGVTNPLVIPSTIVVLSVDRESFPIKWAAVVVKQLFPYGLREIKVQEDKIFVNLSYTPNAKSLKQRFGNLPVRYMRVQLDDEEEFKILEKVVRRYRFNLVPEDANQLQVEMAGSSRRILPPNYYSPLPPSPLVYPPSAQIVIEDEDHHQQNNHSQVIDSGNSSSDEREEPPLKKQKTTLLYPAPSTSYRPPPPPPQRSHSLSQAH